jgi:hypothetical protein
LSFHEEKDMSDTRTDTAREHDDSDLIENQPGDPDAVAESAGGDLARDVGSRDDMTSIADPDGSSRVTSQDESDAGLAEPENRARGSDAAGITED